MNWIVCVMPGCNSRRRRNSMAYQRGHMFQAVRLEPMWEIFWGKGEGGGGSPHAKSKRKPDDFDKREGMINWAAIIGVIGGLGLLFVHWSLSIVFIAVLFGIAIFLRPEVDYACEGDINHKYFN